MTLLLAVSIVEPLLAAMFQEPEDHAFLGISASTSEAGGVEIATVFEKSPAASGGIQVGDRLVKFDGKDIDTMETLQGWIRSKKVGDVVAVAYVRGGETVTTEVVLGSRVEVEAGTYQPLVKPPMPAFEQEPKAEKDAHRARVERVAARLNDDDFDVREAATQALIALGPAVQRYLDAALASKDLELHSRAVHVVKESTKSVPRHKIPKPETRVVPPPGIRPASLEAALQSGKPVIVLSAPPCEFDCARRLSDGPLTDPRVKERAGAFEWVVVTDYGKEADAVRARFATERAVFLGVLDKTGAPVGDLLDAEAGADAVVEALRRAVP